MKQFVFVLALCLALCLGILHFAPQPFEQYISSCALLQCALPNAQAQIFCKNTSLPHVSLGNGNMVQCNATNLTQHLAYCNNVDGVTFCFEPNAIALDLLQKALQLQVCFVTTMDSLVVVCGYSAKICGGVWLDGKLVNVQMACNNGIVSVGSPLLLGSY